METNETLLRAILATVARQAFPPDELVKIVSPNSGGEKQLLAFNYCDGQTAQSEVAKKANLDKGNLSRLISRWMEAGVLIRVGDDLNPMHIYPLPKDRLRQKSEKKSK